MGLSKIFAITPQKMWDTSQSNSNVDDRSWGRPQGFIFSGYYTKVPVV